VNSADYVQGRASQGVNRLVVSPSSELAGMQAEVSSFAHRLGLGCGSRTSSSLPSRSCPLSERPADVSDQHSVTPCSAPTGW
jgi:hypothetical protein